jgi:hypothetical protein
MLTIGASPLRSTLIRPRFSQRRTVFGATRAKRAASEMLTRRADRCLCFSLSMLDMRARRSGCLTIRLQIAPWARPGRAHHERLLSPPVSPSAPTLLPGSGVPPLNALPLTGETPVLRRYDVITP